MVTLSSEGSWRGSSLSALLNCGYPSASERIGGCATFGLTETVVSGLDAPSGCLVAP